MKQPINFNKNIAVKYFYYFKYLKCQILYSQWHCILENNRIESC